MLKIKSKLFFLSALISMCASGGAQGEDFNPEVLSKKLRAESAALGSESDALEKQYIEFNNQLGPVERNLNELVKKRDELNLQIPAAEKQLKDLVKKRDDARAKADKNDIKNNIGWQKVVILDQAPHHLTIHFNNAIAPFPAKALVELQGKCKEITDMFQKVKSPDIQKNFREYISSMNQQLQKAAQALSKSGIDHSSGKPIKFECKLPG